MEQAELGALELKNDKPSVKGSLTSLIPALGILLRTVDKNLANIDPEKDPKMGGLSIEGLAGTPAGELLIGLVRLWLKATGLSSRVYQIRWKQSNPIERLLT